MRTPHRNRGIVRVAGVAAALFGAVVPASAQAVSPSGFPTTLGNGDVPALVRPAADLAAHVPGPEVTWVDSIFIAGRDQLPIWEILDNKAENAWVTVLRPDGSYAVAAVRPLAARAGAFWTSPVTRKTYPTRWRIDIPAVGSRLSVAVTGPRGQEFRDGTSRQPRPSPVDTTAGMSPAPPLSK